MPLICLHFVDREIFTFALIYPTYYIGGLICQVLLQSRKVLKGNVWKASN
jgi:hypothetical protein